MPSVMLRWMFYLYVLFHCSVSFESISDPCYFHLWLHICGWPCVQRVGLEPCKYRLSCSETDLTFKFFHVDTF